MLKIWNLLKSTILAFIEDEALSRIIDMFDAEIARPTDTGKTTPRSQQGH